MLELDQANNWESKREDRKEDREQEAGEHGGRQSENIKHKT